MENLRGTSCYTKQIIFKKLKNTINIHTVMALISHGMNVN